VEYNYGGARPDGSPTLRGMDHGVISGAFFGQSSFATHALISVRCAVRVPDDVDLRLAGPLGCAVQTGVGTVLNTLRPEVGEPVVVFGAGAVGLSAVMGAVVAGCEPIVVDIVPERLRLAQELGATLTLDGRDEALVEKILAGTDNGAPSVVDTTGNPTVLPNAMRALGVGGTCAVVGAVAKGTTVPVDLQHLGRGRHLLGVVEGDSNPRKFIPRLVELWRSGRLPVDRIVRHYPMTEIDRAVREMLDGEVVKPVILFADE
jgi:aryl-alcohol dehydrogenase